MFITNNLGIFAELPYFFPKSQSLIEPIFTGEYSTAKSLRFRRSNSSSISRIPSVNGVRKSWTWSGWIKRGTLGVQQYVYSAFNGSTNECAIRFNADDTLDIEQQNTLSTYDYRIITRQVFRDPAAWFHLVVAVDTTQLLDSSRIRVFINGLEVKDFSTSIYPTRNFDTNFNSTLHTHQIGAWNSSNFFDGYLSDINFIDGESVLPTEFGTINYTIGVWSPKKYTGFYGSNGFYLKFENNLNVPTLGVDSKNENTELIINGTFDTDITGWTVASNITGTPSITWQSTKRARITNAGNSLASAYYQAIPTVIGQTYYAHVYIHAASIGGTTRTISLIKTDGTATNSANAVTLASTTQASVPVGLRGSFVATSTTTYIFVLADILGTGATGADVSQISVSLSDYKNNFTCNNISLAPGSNFDSMTDTPTLCSYASYYSRWNP